MNCRQHGHRQSTNTMILDILRANPGRWMTTNEIVSRMRIGMPKGVGRRLTYLCDDILNIEMQIDHGTHKRFYRYNREVNTR